MNRRSFFKFLGKVTAATGIAAVVGLPEEPFQEWDGMTLDHQSGILSLNEYAKAMDIELSNLLLPNTDLPCTFNGLDEYITTGHGLSS